MGKHDHKKSKSKKSKKGKKGKKGKDQIVVTPASLPKAEFGVEYRDTVSGFVGTCVAIYRYINGCVHVGLEGKWVPDKDKTPFQSFDEARLVRTSDDAPVAVTTDTGGPAPADPARV